ncbi:hypothetical protein UA44_18530, partial [Klebsiella aerogenes]
WVMNYVDGDPANSSQETKARKPLAAAESTGSGDRRQPGVTNTAKFFLRPHYQLANARLAARLPYLFACCRFAHYLKCIVRDKIGSFRERDDMERWLNDWVMNYVDGDPANSSQETKRANRWRPLKYR